MHAGRDPLNGRKRYVERTFRGTKREGFQGACRAHRRSGTLDAQAANKGTFEELLREWLEHATASFSPRTVSTTRGYIDTAIVPGLGSMSVAKLGPADLDQFYRQLMKHGAGRPSVLTGDDKKGARDHPAGADPGRPLGLDLTQSGDLRISTSGRSEGADSADTQGARAFVSSRSGARLRAGDLRHARGVDRCPPGRAHRSALGGPEPRPREH